MRSENRIAHARIEFKKFRIPHPHLVTIAREIENLRRTGEISREQWVANGRRGPRIPHPFLPIIGLSHTGKSTGIQSYLENHFSVHHGDDEIRPVVHVTLSASATTKRLGSDILEEFRDPEFEKGSASALLGRAALMIEASCTDVLILDEIHHLIDSDRGGTAWSVAETIKRMLIRGACPIVLVGIEKAQPLLLNNVQLSNRALPPLFLKPLNFQDPSDRQAFLDHCAGFDICLRKHGIFPRLSNLVASDLPACIYEVSGGVIGVASKVFEIATELAIQVDNDRIMREHIERAIDLWAIPFGYIDYNPVRSGPRSLKARAA